MAKTGPIIKIEYKEGSSDAWVDISSYFVDGEILDEVPSTDLLQDLSRKGAPLLDNI